MVQIVLNDEQVEILSRACEPVRVVDRSGRDLGKLILPGTGQSTQVADPEVALAINRMQEAKRGGGIFYSSKEVLDHLHSLEQS